MGISHNNFPGECQSEYVRHKPAAFIRKPIKLWKFSTSVFSCVCPLYRLPDLSLSPPSLSLLLYLLPYTSIFGHVYVACGTRWTNMQLVISATQSPHPPPWYAPGLVATSNERLDLNTFQGLVVVVGLVLPRITAQHALDSSYIWTNMTCTHSDLVLAARSVDYPPIAPCKSHVGEWELGKGIKMLSMSPKIKMK